MMILQQLSRIRMVLVETTHPGNIGAAARAMKTMGLRRLYLVQPNDFPCAEATARASGADDVLMSAVVCTSLTEALTGCHWVIGTSARSRSVNWPTLDPYTAGRQVIAASHQGEIAVVFGREHSGLSNAEVDLCQCLVQIATEPDFSSLNLAAAVQILAYEIRQALLAQDVPTAIAEMGSPLASVEELERLYRHIETVMIATQFLNPEKPKHLMRKVRRMFGRTGLHPSEVNILRGFLTEIEKHLVNSKNSDLKTAAGKTDNII